MMVNWAVIELKLNLWLSCQNLAHKVVVVVVSKKECFFKVLKT